MGDATYKVERPVVMLKIRDAAHETGLSSYIIRKWCLNGTIAAIRAGNRIFVNMDSLFSYLSNSTLVEKNSVSCKDNKKNPYKY